MKKILIPMALLLAGCSPPGEVPFSDAERAAIEDTILALWDHTLSGIEEVDAEKAYRLFSDRTDTWYIRDGYLYPSIATAEREYAEGFKALSSQRREMDTVAVTVLNRSAAVLFSMGRFFATDTAGVTHPPLELAWSVVWRLQDDGWRIANMHISFPSN